MTLYYMILYDMLLYDTSLYYAVPYWILLSYTLNSSAVVYVKHRPLLKLRFGPGLRQLESFPSFFRLSAEMRRKGV